VSRPLVLVACCSKKMSWAAPARDIYLSPLFRKSRRYAEQHGDGWFILSAKHGLLHPADIIEPYDETLNHKGVGARRNWTTMVAGQLHPHRERQLVVLAGGLYCEWTSGFLVHRPMRGLGIWAQMGWLNRHTTLPDPALSLF